MVTVSQLTECNQIEKWTIDIVDVCRSAGACYKMEKTLLDSLTHFPALSFQFVFCWICFNFRTLSEWNIFWCDRGHDDGLTRDLLICVNRIEWPAQCTKHFPFDTRPKVWQSYCHVNWTKRSKRFKYSPANNRWQWLSNHVSKYAPPRISCWLSIIFPVYLPIII